MRARGRIALVVGAEKMTGAADPRRSATSCSPPATARRRRRSKAASPASSARIAQNYFQRYGDHSEALARIAAKNHRNGVANPYAQMRKDLGFDFCNTSSEKNPLVAGPLRRTDCSLVSDGAAALVIADDETAATLAARDRFPCPPRRSTTSCRCRGATRSRSRAPAAPGIGRARTPASPLDDLDLVETHDCFTIAEMIEYEAMGLAEPRPGLQRVLAEGITADGRPPAGQSCPAA